MPLYQLSRGEQQRVAIASAMIFIVLKAYDM